MHWIYLHSYGLKIIHIECYLLYWWSKATLPKLIINRETISSCNCPHIKYWQFQIFTMTTSFIHEPPLYLLNPTIIHVNMKPRNVLHCLFVQVLLQFDLMKCHVLVLLYIEVTDSLRDATCFLAPFFLAQKRKPIGAKRNASAEMLAATAMIIIIRRICGRP